MKRVYCAGPDVFSVNRENIFKYMKKLCVHHHLEALIPFDSDGSNPTSKAIYENNIALLSSADYVVANLNAFRGKEPDSGTCFEVGFAIARGIPVIGYTIIGNWAQHIGIVNHTLDGLPLCEEKQIVEDFGLPLNLMLAESSMIVRSFPDAIQKISEIK